MRVLIVEDEEGIREGLASFLRHHGHVVHTAASCAGAHAVLDREPVDAMVTDWRLNDGTAHSLLGVGLPVVVITGCPEEIEAGHAVVLRKPVLPTALLAQLQACVLPALRRTAAPAVDSVIATLPVDAQDRVRLLLAVMTPDQAEVDDDGTFVTVSFRPGAQIPDPGLLDRLGGDWMPELAALIDGGSDRPTSVRWRCYRDGRPAGVTKVIAPAAPWPQDGSFAIDLHDRRVSAADLVAVLDRIIDARAAGHVVHVLNVPGHLRLFLELTGRAHELPMRACSGPRLAVHQRQLWN